MDNMIKSYRMGLQWRQAQRHGGKLSDAYDLSGLVTKLKKLAPEFEKANKEARDIKDAVKNRMGLPKKGGSSSAINRDALELALPGHQAGDTLAGGVNVYNYRYVYALRQAQFSAARLLP